MTNSLPQQQRIPCKPLPLCQQQPSWTSLPLLPLCAATCAQAGRAQPEPSLEAVLCTARLSGIFFSTSLHDRWGARSCMCLHLPDRRKFLEQLIATARQASKNARDESSTAHRVELDRRLQPLDEIVDHDAEASCEMRFLAR